MSMFGLKFANECYCSVTLLTPQFNYVSLKNKFDDPVKALFIPYIYMHVIYLSALKILSESQKKD